MYAKIAFALALVLAVLICLSVGAFGGLSWLWILPLSTVGIYIAILGLTLLTVWLICLPVDQSKPQEKDDPFFRKLADFIVDALVSICMVTIDAEGLDKIPAEGRFMLVCNHLSYADPVILLRYFNSKQMAFISKQENAEMFVVGKLMHRLMCQTLPREDDREALKTIIRCINLLKADEVSIGVFPEGYTSKDGLFHKFRNGAFKIAQKAAVPIVVCTLQGTEKVISNALHLRPSRVKLHVLGVVPPEELKGVTTAVIGDRVHAMMAEDLGPEKVAQE